MLNVFSRLIEARRVPIDTAINVIVSRLMADLPEFPVFDDTTEVLSLMCNNKVNDLAWASDPANARRNRPEGDWVGDWILNLANACFAAADEPNADAHSQLNAEGKIVRYQRTCEIIFLYLRDAIDAFITRGNTEPLSMQLERERKVLNSLVEGQSELLAIAER